MMWVYSGLVLTVCMYVCMRRVIGLPEEMRVGVYTTIEMRLGYNGNMFDNEPVFLYFLCFFCLCI